MGPLSRWGAPARGTEAGRIAAAQRALTKLGFGPLKSDGLMGAGTKAAIERFERNRNLPATGVLGTRTARLLAQQAGIEID
jgi:peptidoglycan hydrolase-like protein with peptidoglycan-binding domain